MFLFWRLNTLLELVAPLHRLPPCGQGCELQSDKLTDSLQIWKKRENIHAEKQCVNVTSDLRPVNQSMPPLVFCVFLLDSLIVF